MINRGEYKVEFGCAKSNRGTPQEELGYTAEAHRVGVLPLTCLRVFCCCPVESLCGMNLCCFLASATLMNRHGILVCSSSVLFPEYLTICT